MLFIASADQPVGRAEIDFLVEIRRYADRVVCLLNKADHLSEAELREVLAFTTRVVHGALQATVPLVPFSARLACTDDGHGSPASLRNGALTELEHRLRTLLGEERCAVWIASITRARSHFAPGRTRDRSRVAGAVGAVGADRGQPRRVHGQEGRNATGDERQ
ncbi:MAG TPA: hypothetical protein VMG60_23915 [Burkholderiaceae bacterium]|nr:hypothetical protein [Burkholderiaceae bacterium]